MKRNILPFYLLGCFWITPIQSAQSQYTKMRVEVGAGSAAVIAADLNNDGHLDIVSANASAHTLTLIRGDGGGSFSPFALGTVAAGDQRNFFTTTCKDYFTLCQVNWSNNTFC